MAEVQKVLRLNSPVGGEYLTYPWPLVKTKHYDPATEIIETIRMVMNQYEELKTVMNKFVKLDSIDRNSFDQMKNLCDRFSRAADTIRNLWKGATRPSDHRSGERADVQMLRLIVTLAFNRAVTDPESLNHHYEAFSSETYGETSFDRLQKIIDEIKPGDRDVFVDLGSGVGQVVVHMAGGSKCRKCIGIEIADVPSLYAETLKSEFKRWTKWYGKKYKPFELHRGDFLDEKFRNLITKEATIIFINNYAFTPDLEHQIKTKLLSELKDGTNIISTKSYCPLNVRLTERHMADVAAIMDVRELTPCPQPCSWTSNNVQYYLHTINHGKLEQYFMSHKAPLPEGGNGSRRSWSKSSSNRSSRDSSESNGRELTFDKTTQMQPSTEETDAAVYGPTTRRQWNVWVSQQQRHKKEKRHVEPLTVKEEEDTSSYEISANEELGPKVKTKLKGVRGRPRKSEAERIKIKAMKTKQKMLTSPRQQLAPRRSLDSETQAGLERMHNLTLAMMDTEAPPVSVSDDDVYVSNLPKVSECPSRYGSLDDYLVQMKTMFEEQLDYMQTDQFRQSVYQAIEIEKARKDQLSQRAEYLDRQVKQLQTDGVRLLKQRMRELNIQAETPAELLNQAKEIVVRHKDLEAKAIVLEKEVGMLYFQNQHLVQLYRERDEQTVQSGILNTLGLLPEQQHASVESAKDGILHEIGMAFSVKKALLSEVNKLETEVVALQNSLPTNISALMEPTVVAVPSIQTSSTSIATQPLVAATQTLTQSLSSTVSSGLPPKHRRHRTSGAGGRPKKPLSNVSTTRERSNLDPKQQEEMERQIQDIVQKALSVDNAAKSAEKERKAKTAERKRAVRTTTGSGGLESSTTTPSQEAIQPNVTLLGTQVSHLPTSTTALSFSSPGLVPVFSQGSNNGRPPSTTSTTATESSSRHHRKRKRSGSSTETESAPSDFEEETKRLTELRQVAVSQSAGRPSSVPVGQSKFRIHDIMSMTDDSSASVECPRVRSAFPRVD